MPHAAALPGSGSRRRGLRKSACWVTQAQPEPAPQPKEPLKEKKEEQTGPDKEQQKLVVGDEDFAAFCKIHHK